VEKPDVSEKYIGSIFRVENYTNQKASRSRLQASACFFFDFLFDFNDGSEIGSETLDFLRTTRLCNPEENNL
jgi:hypothetical protein